MKTIRIVCLLILLMCTLPVRSQDKYKIVELIGCESIRIGGRYLNVGASFNDNEKIDWNNDNQILRARKIGDKSENIMTFTRKSMKKKTTIVDYFLHKQAGVARGAGYVHSNVHPKDSYKRIAMVIGNSNYIHQSRLPNAITDAIAVSESLLAKGFDVILELDGDAAALYQDIDEFLMKVKNYGKECISLFYYAGHGIQVDRIDYIVPLDANLDSPSRIKSGECYPINYITDELQKLPTFQNLIIIDACRIKGDNYPDSRNYFVAPNTNYGTCILYSTKSGEPSYDGKGTVSPFAKAFIEETAHIGKQWPEITSRIFDYVYSMTGGVQEGLSLGTTRVGFIFYPNPDSLKQTAIEKKYGTHTAIASSKNVTVSSPATKPAKTGVVNGHEYVNLDLPSGLLWAACNIGAKTPYEKGFYFAWGETTTKQTYEWANLKYCNDTKGDSFSKYDTGSDCRSSLELSDDVAANSWSSTWHIPTMEDWDELRDNCLWSWVNDGERQGYRITSKTNGQSIFLPASGWFGGSKINGDGEYGFYWSSNLHTEKIRCAFSCAFDKERVNTKEKSNRFDGQSVRPVCTSK